MKNISDVDKNFKEGLGIPPDTDLYDIRDGKFRIYGLYKPHEKGQFRRIPYEVAKNTSDGVVFNHTHTAGGRVRFKTDSNYIVLKAIYPSTCVMPHMPVTGSSAFDLYVDNQYYKTFVPPIKYTDTFNSSFCIDNGYESVVEFPDKKMRDIIINFPLYNDVSDVFIGMAKDCKIESGNEYKHKVPVVYYGSSITQGGCASRPGNSYQAILSRHLDCNYINLGFSGNAMAEKAMYEYISQLDMSVFVYDYDHNAPTSEFLEETHSKMFWAIREKNPDLPVIMLTMPTVYQTLEETQKRMEIIHKTYTDARSKGDKNVYFISGMDIFNSLDPDIMSVDGIHPNDFGFYCMATEIEKVLKNLL